MGLKLVTCKRLHLHGHEPSEHVVPDDDATFVYVFDVTCDAGDVVDEELRSRKT